MDLHQTICAVDIAGYGSMARTRTDFVTIREGLFQSVKEAFDEAGIPWHDCFHQNTGDSLLILVPTTVPKAIFAATLPRALNSTLRQYNDNHPAEERLKLRLALHAGEITFDQHGPTSYAIIHAFRLLDAAPLKAALSASAEPLGMIASSWFYEDVIRHDPAYEPELYHRVAVNVKEFEDVGWIRVMDNKIPAAALGPVTHGTMTVAPTLRLVSPEFYEVVGALEEIPCLQDESSRALVIDQLPFAGSIAYFSSRRAHLTSILRTCLDYEDGLVQLLSAVTRLEPAGSIPVKRLHALLTGEAT